jgi:hypothetical protein
MKTQIKHQTISTSSNSSQIEKIDQINTRIKSILQNIKSDQREQIINNTETVIQPSLLQNNSNTSNIRLNNYP